MTDPSTPEPSMPASLTAHDADPTTPDASPSVALEAPRGRCRSGLGRRSGGRRHRPSPRRGHRRRRPVRCRLHARRPAGPDAGHARRSRSPVRALLGRVRRHHRPLRRPDRREDARRGRHQGHVRCHRRPVQRLPVLRCVQGLDLGHQRQLRGHRSRDADPRRGRRELRRGRTRLSRRRRPHAAGLASDPGWPAGGRSDPGHR